jgi:hypothetical protein
VRFTNVDQLLAEAPRPRRSRRPSEREQSVDAVALHGRHETHVVRPEARHAVGLHEAQPKFAQLIVVGQEHETPQEETHPLRGLGGAHA